MNFLIGASGTGLNKNEFVVKLYIFWAIDHNLQVPDSHCNVLPI